MTKDKATAATSAEARSRRKAYLPRLLLAIPLLIILASRLTDLGDVDAQGWLWGLGLGAVILVFSVVAVSTTYRRRLRKLAALAGSDSWAAVCADPDQPRQWQALLVDTGGVRAVDRSGVTCREWRYDSIRDVRVERFPVEIITRPGVVLYLADDSRAEILLGGSIGYTAARAEAAAEEILRRLAAFDGQVHPL